MTTSTPSQPTLWDSLSTSSPEDSLASLLVSPGSDEARRMTVTSGRKWLGLLANAGPAGSLVRTLLESSAWRSTIVSLTWKASVTKRGRLFFRLAASAPGTAESASGLWPTPTTGEGKSVGPAERQVIEDVMNGAPMPTCHQRLRNKVMLYSTPRTEGFDAGANRGKPDSLHSFVKMLPTPHASCHTGAGTHGDGGPNLQTVIGGSLNPEFVEWLQGFPIGWTEV